MSKRTGQLKVMAYEHPRHVGALESLYARVWGESAGAHRGKIVSLMHECMPGRDRHPLRFVIVDGDCIAGTLGYLPADFLINGACVPVRFTFDLLVDPQYAAAGLRLSRRTLGMVLVDQALLEGELFLGGMWMTPSSHKIHLATGFTDALPLQSYTLPLDPGPFIARRGLPPAKAAVALAGLSANRVRALARATFELKRRDTALQACAQFDAAWDATWLDLARTYAATRVRDAAYLNWKYSNHPTLGYRIVLAQRGGKHVGFMLWRNATADEECRRAIVVDFLVARGDARTLRNLISRVIVDANASRMESVSILTPQPWAARVLRRMGFLPRGGRNSWVVAGWERHIPREWLQDPDVWHLCMGDSDGDIWSGIVSQRPTLARIRHDAAAP